jgi:hypothetical protein
MPGKRLVQFEKVPHTPEIQGRIGQQLKAQYDVAEPIPDRLGSRCLNIGCRIAAFSR